MKPTIQTIAFRFAVVYLGLFCLATQIAGSLFLVPPATFRGLGTLWPMRDITLWIAVHVFGISQPLVFTRNSGETLFFWVQTFWLLALSLVVVAIWTALEAGSPLLVRRSGAKRRGGHASRNVSASSTTPSASLSLAATPPHEEGTVAYLYPSLRKWFRLFVRLALAAAMFEYGMTKIIPVQFPPPPLTTLVSPVGNQTLSALLWTTIGSSPGYELFTGFAELLAGVLLLFPRTTTLGALICLADMTQVFVLNLSFDIGLKLISFHLIVMTLFVLAPEFRRLAAAILAPSESKMGRIAVIAPIAIGIYLIGIQTYANWTYWNAAGSASPRSPLYGIWNVDELSVDGEASPASLNEYDRQWRRVIFDTPDVVAFQRLDDSFARYGIQIDVYNNALALTKGNSRHWKSGFTFQRPANDRLILDGEMDNHKIHMQLQLVEFDTFRLLNSRFRWVRPDEQ